jgi:hypothetical protein
VGWETHRIAFNEFPRPPGICILLFLPWRLSNGGPSRFEGILRQEVERTTSGYGRYLHSRL